jgi:hypothetical protein
LHVRRRLNYSLLDVSSCFPQRPAFILSIPGKGSESSALHSFLEEKKLLFLPLFLRRRSAGKFVRRSNPCHFFSTVGISIPQKMR